MKHSIVRIQKDFGKNELSFEFEEQVQISSTVLSHT